MLRWIKSTWWGSAQEILAAMDAVLAPRSPPWLSLGSILLATLGAWFLYVPIHELMHALGCVTTGGRVDELQIATLYGGGLLEQVFPFVVAGGEYAGRLTEFDTGGSDLVYLATDLAPYLLTLLGAFPLLRAARARASALLLGPGVVLTAAPVLSLVGDYYEIGSILVSATLRALGGGGDDARWMALRHDDLAALLGEFTTRFPDDALVGGIAVTGSALVGWLLAGATLAAGRRLADLFGAGVENT